MKNWKLMKLGDVCNIIGGGTPSKSNPKFYNGNILWATVRDMKFEIIENTEHKITREAVRESSTNVIPKGNVIIATRVGLGKVCIIANDTAINQDLKAIIPKDTDIVNVGYLFQWLKSISKIIVNEGTGATVQGVKLSFIKALDIPLPPLDEQIRIVYTLDQAHQAITNAKENAQKKLLALEELEKSLMQKAFRGELNATQTALSK